MTKKLRHLPVLVIMAGCTLSVLFALLSGRESETDRGAGNGKEAMESNEARERKKGKEDGEDKEAKEDNETMQDTRNSIIDSINREAEAYRKEAFDHSEAGRYREAILAYKKYIVLDPYDARTYARMGDIYSNLNQYRDAIAAYKKTIDNLPDEAAFAFYNMPDVYGRLEQYTDSIAVHNEGVDIVQTGLHRVLVSAYWNMGNAHSELKQHAEAVAAYKKCIALDPTGKNADDARKRISELSTTQPTDK